MKSDDCFDLGEAEIVKRPSDGSTQEIAIAYDLTGKAMVWQALGW